MRDDVLLASQLLAAHDFIWADHKKLGLVKIVRVQWSSPSLRHAFAVLEDGTLAEFDDINKVEAPVSSLPVPGRPGIRRGINALIHSSLRRP